MAEDKLYGTAVAVKAVESRCTDEEGTGEVSASHQTFMERWKNREYKRKYIKTLWLGASFWALVSDTYNYYYYNKIVVCSLEERRR